MKIIDINNNDQQGITQITDLENFFNIYIDKKNNYFYNLNSTVYINADDSLDEYILKADMFWPLISYKLYGTTRLAWLLLKVNNVNADDIFKMRTAGEKIRYLSKDFVEKIVASINGY